MKNEKAKITKLLGKIDKPGVMKQRQDKLVTLVHEYGYDNVSLASGWSVPTIIQYCKTATPKIGLDKLEQAEQILTQL